MAVAQATLDVRAGELAVLLGRSGSGKSTLLMALGGFVDPDAGDVETPGTRWDETAYVAQRFGLLGELTVAENVRLPERLGGSPLTDVLTRSSSRRWRIVCRARRLSASSSEPPWRVPSERVRVRSSPTSRRRIRTRRRRSMSGRRLRLPAPTAPVPHCHA